VSGGKEKSLESWESRGGGVGGVWGRWCDSMGGGWEIYLREITRHISIEEREKKNQKGKGDLSTGERTIGKGLSQGTKAKKAII